jgi:hypothetical protein
MILTGRVGMEGPSDDEEEEGTEIVGRSREPEEAKVLSIRTGGASDLEKKKKRGQQARRSLFPKLVMRKASCFSILAPQKPQRKSRVAVDYQNSRLINSLEYFRFHSADELCKTKNK